MQRLVSIIIPTYNRAHLIGETLDSILAQSYEEFECIIIDDGSVDYTEELIEFYHKRDPRIHYYPRPEKMAKGANSCRNYGFELSNGDFVVWFDSDDVMLPCMLEKQIESFEKNTQLSICFGYYTDGKLDNRRETPMMDAENLFKGLVLWKNHILTPSVMFSRNFLVGKKLFDEKISRGQEGEFFARLLFKIHRQDYKIINNNLFLYRGHPQSITFKNREYIKTYVISQSYTAIENLKRGIHLNDKEIIEFCYSKLIHYFFRGFENEHRENSIYILKKLVPLLWKCDRKLGIEFLFYGSLLVALNRGSYSIERKFRYSL